MPSSSYNVGWHVCCIVRSYGVGWFSRRHSCLGADGKADCERGRPRVVFGSCGQNARGVRRGPFGQRVHRAQEFAAEVGFPMVLKPPSGMGAKSTWRVNSLEELVRGVAGIGASAQRPILAEEFLRGAEAPRPRPVAHKK